MTSETNHGLGIESSDFFWVYGTSGGFYTLGRSDTPTIWISADAVDWSPLDISFADSQFFVQVVGDTIFIYSDQIDDYWVGHVEQR